MKYIIVFTILLHTSLFALEFSFDDLRKQERISVLKEFKKLYYQRKNIHQNMSQVLKNARSKSLQKNQISFFQVKTKYKEEYLSELSNVYLQIPCERDCQASLANEESNIIDSVTDNADNADNADFDGAIEEPVNPINISNDTTTNIRKFTDSPWAKR